MAVRSEMFGQNRRRRPVVGADVLEHGAVARVLGMVIDDEVRAIEQAAEVMRLHVDSGDPLEAAERGWRDLFHLDVEHVRHPQVFRPRHALHRADNRRRLRPAQKVSQRESARQRVGIGIVVQKDQHAVCVREVALVLLHARARHRPA